MSILTGDRNFYTNFFLFFAFTSFNAWGVYEGTPKLINLRGEHEFIAACREGNGTALEHYLEVEPVDPDTVFDVVGKSYDGFTGLYVACQEGKTNIVRMLISAKCNVNLGRKNGVSPLLIAAQRGHFAVVTLLLETPGIQIDGNGDPILPTPLYSALEHGHTDLAELLQKKGADIHRGFGVKSVMQLAVEKRNCVYTDYQKATGEDKLKLWKLWMDYAKIVDLMSTTTLKPLKANINPHMIPAQGETTCRRRIDIIEDDEEGDVFMDNCPLISSGKKRKSS